MPPLRLTKPAPPRPNLSIEPPAPPVRKAWHEVLRECGYPTTVLVLDFESYYDEDFGLRKLSVIEYINDPRFEVLGLAAGLLRPGQPGKFKWVEGDAADQQIQQWTTALGADFARVTVLAQNASFDLSILSRRYGIHPRYIIDLLGLARHQHARQRNDLGTLCRQYGLKEKGDTTEFIRCTLREGRHVKGSRGKYPAPLAPMDADKRRAMAEYAINDAEREAELFALLLPRLSNPKTELRLIQHTVEMFTRPMLRVDFEKANAITAAMGGTMHARRREFAYAYDTAPDVRVALDLPTFSSNDFTQEICHVLEDAEDDPAKYFKTGKAGPLLAISKSDPQREALLAHPNEDVRKLMRGRVAVKSWPLHIARVKRIAAMAQADGGRLPVPLNYYGAHTGRASGGGKINLQNLGSRGDPLISEVRQMLVAPQGTELVIVDASAIEARVLAWIAGQWDLVGKFAAGAEIYCEFAAKVLGHPVPHPKTCAIAAIKAKATWARNSVGKIGVLGAGYGMGAAKAELYAGGAITFDIAEKIIQTYRAENRKIVKFWYDIEKAFTYAAKYRKPCAMERGLSFRHEAGCDVVITLPNGRDLRYPRVRIGGDGLEVRNEMKKTWERIWGGTLVENVVQAMSRDVLFEAMLRLEDMRYRTVLHCHDEMVLVVPKGEGERVEALAVAELSRTPTWAPRLALAAEGCVADRYGKA